MNDSYVVAMNLTAGFTGIESWMATTLIAHNTDSKAFRGSGILSSLTVEERLTSTEVSLPHSQTKVLCFPYRGSNIWSLYRNEIERISCASASAPTTSTSAALPTATLTFSAHSLSSPFVTSVTGLQFQIC